MKTFIHNVSRFGIATALLLLCTSAWAQQHVLGQGTTPTRFSVTNTTKSPVYAYLVLGQPPVTPPAGCTLGQQIINVTDPNLVFTSSVPGKKVAFSTPPNVNDKGWYQMAAGETIIYQPQAVSCGSNGGSQCSPALTFNVFFTHNANGFSANNGCSNPTFPNATNLAEGSINFPINGAIGSTCPNADDTDISAVNGVNSMLQILTPGNGWPIQKATNRRLGRNANQPGVFGWAATTCTGDTGYPNPSANCAAPVNAPRAPAGPNSLCKYPGSKRTYAPISSPGSSTFYCAELSSRNTCNNQRTANTTGGTVQILYNGPAYPSSAQ